MCMTDDRTRTKEQLLADLATLRQRMMALEALEAGRQRTKAALLSSTHHSMGSS
ncbi:hypothetical protein NKDENANG_02364 [Candidatus Entotheonellaceae bacterium PAL068K]